MFGPVQDGREPLGAGFRRGRRKPANKPIALPGKRLNQRWCFSRIVECVSQTVDSLVQTLVEVDKSAIRPKALDQFLAPHQFSRLLEQNLQDLEGLSRQD